VACPIYSSHYRPSRSRHLYSNPSNHIDIPHTHGAIASRYSRAHDRSARWQANGAFFVFRIHIIHPIRLRRTTLTLSQVFLGLTRAEVLALTTWQWPQPYLEHIRHAAQNCAAAIGEEDDDDEDEDEDGVVEGAATTLRAVVKEEAARLREVFSLGGLMEDVEKVFMVFLAKALT
jgi:hypothetical protein